MQRRCGGRCRANTTRAAAPLSFPQPPPALSVKTAIVRGLAHSARVTTVGALATLLVYPLVERTVHPVLAAVLDAVSWSVSVSVRVCPPTAVDRRSGSPGSSLVACPRALGPMQARVGTGRVHPNDAHSTGPAALERQPRWEKNEFVDKIVFFKEKSVEIAPEVHQENFVPMKGLIFSVF